METQKEQTAAASQSPAALFFAWLTVGAPLIWGVLQTIKKALALFR